MSSFKPRRGLDPTIIRLKPGPDLLSRVTHVLHAKGAQVSVAEIADAIERGDIGLVSNDRAYIHRPIPDDVDVELPVIAQTDQYVAIDKPAGLASTPQGSYIARSILVQARRQFGDSITCAHRLDRATSGVMLLVKTPEHRSAYQRLFEKRKVDKVYEFVALYRDNVPERIESRLKQDGNHMVTVPGEPNAITSITLRERRGQWGIYEARPITGQTHQIRVHAASLHIPILGDTIYGPGAGVPDRISLLSRSLSFVDPLSDENVNLVSAQELPVPETCEVPH